MGDENGSENMPNLHSALQGADQSSEDDVSPNRGQNDDMYYDNQDQEDVDFHDDLDNDADDDLIDDDVIDEEVQLEMQKQAVERAVSFDSESVSNASPLPNQKKIRSMRHAATLAADGTGGVTNNNMGASNNGLEHRSQNYDTD